MVRQSEPKYMDWDNATSKRSDRYVCHQQQTLFRHFFLASKRNNQCCWLPNDRASEYVFLCKQIRWRRLKLAVVYSSIKKRSNGQSITWRYKKGGMNAGSVTLRERSITSFVDTPKMLIRELRSFRDWMKECASMRIPWECANPSLKNLHYAKSCWRDWPMFVYVLFWKLSTERVAGDVLHIGMVT